MPPNEPVSGPPALIPAGGEGLCLAFANTRYWRGSPAPTETLAGYADLVRWLDGAGVLPAGMAPDGVSGDPAWQTAVFVDAIALRETIYRIFAAIGVGEAVRDEDLAALNQALATAPARTRLDRGPDGYVWFAPAPADSNSLLLAPILWSAADLLTAIDRRRIRRCANDQCLWLFIDESRTGTRRWCDMAACGNRAKARRHYLKTRRS